MLLLNCSLFDACPLIAHDRLSFWRKPGNPAVTNVLLNHGDHHIRAFMSAFSVPTEKMSPCLLVFHLKILRLELPSPSNGEIVNEIFLQTCDVR